MSRNPPLTVFLSSHGGNLYAFVLALLQFSLSAFIFAHLFFFFLKCQCLTSMSCWLVFFQAIRVMEVPVVKIRECKAGSKEKIMIKSIVAMVQYSVCLSVWMTLWHFDGTLGCAAWPLIHTGYSFNHSAWLTYWCWTDLWMNIYNEFCVLLQPSQSNFLNFFKKKTWTGMIIFNNGVSVCLCLGANENTQMIGRWVKHQIHRKR